MFSLFFQGLFSRITFALPVVLGSPEGHFSNTAHFLETSGSFQGCIRNLEINNKLYNFALQNNGGDAIEGVDIGKCILGFAVSSEYFSLDRYLDKYLST